MPFSNYFVGSGWDQSRHDHVVRLIRNHLLKNGCPLDNVDEKLEVCFDVSYKFLVKQYTEAPGSHERAKRAVGSMLSENYVAWCVEMIAYATRFTNDGEGSQAFRRHQCDFRVLFPLPPDDTPPLDEKFAAAVLSRVLGVDNSNSDSSNESPQPMETSQEPVETPAIATPAPSHPLHVSRGTTPQQPPAKRVAPDASPELQQQQQQQQQQQRLWRQETPIVQCAAQRETPLPMETGQSFADTAAVNSASPSQQLLVSTSKTPQQPSAAPELEQPKYQYHNTQQRQQTPMTQCSTQPKSHRPVETSQALADTATIPAAASWHPLLIGRSMTHQQQPPLRRIAPRPSPQRHQTTYQHKEPEQQQQEQNPIPPSSVQVVEPAGPLAELSNRNEVTPNEEPSPMPQARPRKRAPNSTAAQHPEKKKKVAHPVFAKLAVADPRLDEDEAEAKTREVVLEVPTNFANLVALGRGLGKSWSEIGAWMLPIDRIINEERAKLLRVPQHEDRDSVGPSRPRAGTL